MKQAETATAHYRHPDTQKRMGEEAKIVLFIVRTSTRPLTLSEIRRELRRRMGDAWDRPESTISGRCNELERDGLLSPDGDKRPCEVTGVRKQVWRYVSKNERKARQEEQGSLFGRIA